MNSKRATVLCIDDEQLIRRLFTDYLGDTDYEVLCAENGREGLDLFQTELPDLVFVDLRMPVMDGFDVLSTLHKISPETPIVVVSGIGGMHDVIRALRLGAWNFISKPLDNMAILDHVIADSLEKAGLIRENRIYKESLEKLVREKTHDLETTNRRLHQSLQKLEQEIEERKRVEKALQKTRDELEARVRERTEDLLKTNLRLKQEIEERLLVEIQLQQSQRLEALGTLAGGIAHDFNNILYPIVGYTEMTMDDVPEESLAWSNLEEILKAAYRAKGLVQQILTFSRQTDQGKRSIRLQSVVKEAMKLLRATLPTTVVVHQHIDEQCGPVFADPTQIHQVLINLCTNAYHAMRDNGGILDVSVAEVFLGPEDVASLPELLPGRYTKLEIKDTGRGIAPENLDRIFEPYFTTKNPGEGTGMGLAVTHGIIKSSKGRIYVESKLWHGTTVGVYLPSYQTKTVEVDEAHEESVEKGHERILVVDDEKQVVLMVKQMLERLGYHVTAFTDSTETLQTFIADPDMFDLVITDMTMPNITGEQLALKIKAVRPELPIILCTGFSETISEEKAKAIGISEYVMKPIVKSEMAKILRNVLDHH